MLKKLLLATTVCIALSACNDSSSSSSSQPNEPLTELTFSNLSSAASIARVESSDEGSHLIGFDADGAPIGDISNVNVDKFTPVSDGGLVVEVVEKHHSSYYYQTIADQGEVNPPQEKTFRNPVWYYVQSNGIYYLITDKSTEFVGENSKGLLAFSNGDTFDTKHHRSGHFYNSLKLTPSTITDALAELPDDLSGIDAVEKFFDILIEKKTLEKTKTIIEMNGDNLLSTSEKMGSVLIESAKGTPLNFSSDICNELSGVIKTICNRAIIPAIKNGALSNFIGIHKKLNDSDSKVSQIISVPDSDLTLLNTGLLSADDSIDTSFAGVWNGESSYNSEQAYILSSSFIGQDDCQAANQQCLYSLIKTQVGSIIKKDTVEANIVLDANTGFETNSDAGQIEGGQQKYLWVNDSYIVIKEASQISIIDRTNNNTLLDPILVGTEIDTINLTGDSKLYITATDSSGQPAAYIYDIATGKGLESPVTDEKLHAFKALIK